MPLSRPVCALQSNYPLIRQGSLLFFQVEDVSQDRAVIDAAVKQYLHRMVICLEQDMLPSTPRIFMAFTKVPNPVVINDFLALLTQMVNRFKVSYSNKWCSTGDIYVKHF